MRKIYFKKILTSVLVTGLLLSSLTGCSKRDTSKFSAKSVKENADNKFVEKEGWWTPDMAQYQKDQESLHITEEQKINFIKKYGEDPYYSALASCVNFLTLNKNSSVDENGLEALKKKYKVKSLNLKSTFGDHSIPADYITTGDENNDTVILVHGQGCTRRTNLGIGSRFLERGYNILTFDLRSSGENTAPFSTFGAWEKYDLQDCVNFVAKRVAKPNKIIIWAASYGGSVLAAGLGMDDINEKVDYAIFDSPVTDMDSMIRFQLVNYIDEAQIDDTMKACDLFLKEIIGFSMDEANGLKCAKDTKVPVLMFASKSDKMVPYEFAKSLYDAIKGNNKILHSFENVGHTMGSETKSKEYFNTIEKFIKKYSE